ncbi:flavin-containing monooxygenase [Lutimaribacter saemankumensis]|uniref:Putative flavoprotein involved in K+ transport n=1 Tax=Lutimaribacter saemankumensis TaxID=490829 RepID=A0A1G8H243_9RHOB|nr:NAD(P)/FAD-dependent oxidoreductase [Lutimaribacter saemankumensis]SDI00629.1 putative flavoprotein involved in K+ transport [Lutimaribacter saemankumensis]
MEKTHTLVVGGGQAGIAMSEHLGAQGIPHIVLERDRIAERWRSERWDSLVANGPAWHDRFPNLEFSCGGEEFAGKEAVADYFVDYAANIGAPIRCGVEVTHVTPLAGKGGFRAETSAGVIQAQSVVAATGPFQRPVIPPLVPSDAPVTQMHSNAYRNPAQLPPGAVLVVGAGSSGVQIAEELMRAGRQVYLSVGPHDRPPRRYRGRDFVWWLGVLGKWNAETPGPGTEHVTIAVSGADGGKTVEFRALANQGMTLVGMTEGYDAGVMRFAPDLADNLRNGDRNYLSVLDEADAYIEANGLDLPPEPQARVIPDDPACVTDPLRALDLAKAGIGTILWATGYALDYGWLAVDTFDDKGRPIHQRGVSQVPGIYFLGLPWQSRRGSSFIWGVWHDAKFIADQIAIQRGYMAYHDAAQPVAENA